MAADVSEMGRYCVLCKREYGPDLKTCCGPSSLVAFRRGGLFRKRIEYFALDGRKLDENSLAALREAAATARDAASSTDPIKLFRPFLESPDPNSYLAAREALIASDSYDPYSIVLETAHEMLSSGRHAEAQSAIFDSFPNLLLSPRAHLILAAIAAEAGNEPDAERERALARACICGILSTGDGSQESPYLVVRTSDEYDVLFWFDKKLSLQELVHDGPRRLDAMNCEDGATLWFDVTDAYNRLSNAFREKR